MLCSAVVLEQSACVRLGGGPRGRREAPAAADRRSAAPGAGRRRPHPGPGPPRLPPPPYRRTRATTGRAGPACRQPVGDRTARTARTAAQPGCQRRAAASARPGGRGQRRAKERTPAAHTGCQRNSLAASRRPKPAASRRHGAARSGGRRRSHGAAGPRRRVAGTTGHHRPAGPTGHGRPAGPTGHGRSAGPPGHGAAGPRRVAGTTGDVGPAGPIGHRHPACGCRRRQGHVAAGRGGSSADSGGLGRHDPADVPGPAVIARSNCPGARHHVAPRLEGRHRSAGGRCACHGRPP
jgi:hypothetical protein